MGLRISRLALVLEKVASGKSPQHPARMALRYNSVEKRTISAVYNNLRLTDMKDVTDMTKSLTLIARVREIKDGVGQDEGRRRECQRLHTLLLLLPNPEPCRAGVTEGRRMGVLVHTTAGCGLRVGGWCVPYCSSRARGAEGASTAAAGTVDW